MDKDLIYRMLLVSGAIILACSILWLLIDLVVAILYYMLVQPLACLGVVGLLLLIGGAILYRQDGRF